MTPNVKDEFIIWAAILFTMVGQMFSLQKGALSHRINVLDPLTEQVSEFFPN